MRPLWFIALAGCGFSGTVGADAPSMFDDAGRQIRPWNFDTSADFQGETIGMTIDPRGSLTPDGYIYGGLLARGIAGMKLWTNTDADWSKLDTVTPAGYGIWAGQTMALVAEQNFQFVGITNTNTISIAMEGEIWINAPSEQLAVMGNDTAFVYVSTDRRTFEKIAQQGTGTVTVATSGWYPIRIGWADGDNSGDFQFEVSDGAGGTAPATHTRFRAPASALRGTLRNVYYRQIHGGGARGRPPVMSIQDTPLQASTNFSPPLPGSVTTSTTPFDWSARWTGQFYADMAGSYTFQIASRDGSQLRLGTGFVDQHYVRDDNGSVTTTVTANLVAGWNDLVIDYNHVTNTPSFGVQITAAPDATLVGKPIPLDRLRPVEPRVDRLITQTTIPTSPPLIPDDQNQYIDLLSPIVAHPDERVSLVEVTARVTTQRIQQLTYRLTAPDGATTNTSSLIESADGGVPGSFIAHGTFTLGMGMPANGTWKFGIADNSSSGGSNVTNYQELHVTVRTTGGREQIATSAVWRSKIVDNTTAVSQVDFVRWQERVPAGASVTVRMQTCAIADCTDGEWSAPIDNGGAPMLPARRYIQMQVEMTSDGTVEPEVTSINAQYRTDPK